jgi:hypothetical protein
MDEGRKRVLGILTAILVAPRLKDWAWDGRGGASTCEGFVHAAMGVAERIMSMIDRKYAADNSRTADQL